jgi:V8-like Glu-specific endopeptidase
MIGLKIPSLLAAVIAGTSLVGCSADAPPADAADVGDASESLQNGTLEPNGAPGIVRFTHFAPDGSLSSCTGTIIGRSLALTSAHCFDAALTSGAWSRVRVYMQKAADDVEDITGYRELVSVIRHPSYVTSDRPPHDIAIIRRDRPFKNVTPGDYRRLFVGNQWSPNSLLVYGAGRFDPNASVPPDFRLRSAFMAASWATPAVIDLSSNEGVRTCRGDSGGPVTVASFRPFACDDEGAVAGVHSGSLPPVNGECAGSRGSRATSLRENADFIVRNIAGCYRRALSCGADVIQCW